MKYFWILVVFIFGVVAAQSDECDLDNGWHELNGYCFRLSRSAPETLFTWQESRQTCMDEGADLASINSEEEQDFITEIAVSTGLQGLRLWTGMSQMDDKTGPFVWSDGSEIVYTDWSSSEPRRYGITNCGYTLTERPPTGFIRRDYTSVTEGILDPDNNIPEEADGIDTFFFGRGSDYDIEDCERACEVENNCAAYSYHWYNSRASWDGACVGRSDKYNISAESSYADGGIRAMGASPDGWWLTANCGLQFGFVCKKLVGSDESITLPPTEPVESYCPAGYFSADGHTGNKCYRIYQMDDNSPGLQWPEALLACRQGPGVNPDLASIHSVQDNAIINSQIVDNGIGYWIGGHYSHTHTIWVWADNTQPVYSNWAPNMPSGLEQCMEYWGKTVPSGMWSNLACESVRGYICQTYKDSTNIVPTPPLTTPSSCPEGWDTYRGNCYRLNTELRTWQQAADNCVNEGSQLVSIHSESENSAVFLTSGGNFPMWIGLHQLDVADPTYVWADNTPNLYANFEVIGPWGAGCVHMRANAKWRELGCNDTYMSMCKITLAPIPTVPPPQERGCPSVDWIPWGGHCYLFSREIVQYNEAIVMCRALGSESFETDLVSIASYEENEFIVTQFTIDQAYYSTWLGLEFDTVSLTYQWRDGSTSAYRNWAPDNPENPVAEPCAEMTLYSDETIGKWNDQECDDYGYFICKTAIGPAPTYPPISTSAPGECPSIQWLKHDTDCFLIKPVQELTWQASLDMCKLLTGEEGSLASIHNQEENQFIFLWAEYLKPDFVTPNLWIGFYKQGYGYPFIWTDSTSVDYTHWAYNEPNDIDGTKSCVRMYLSSEINTARWDDHYCADSYNHGYVCRTKQGSYNHLNQDVIDMKSAEIVKYSKKQRIHTMKKSSGVFNFIKEANVVHSKDTSYMDKAKNKPKQDIPAWMSDRIHNVMRPETNNNPEELKSDENDRPNHSSTAIALGAVAGILLLMSIILAVYVKKRNKTNVSQHTPVYSIQMDRA